MTRDPQLTGNKLIMTAGKLNKPKSNGVDSTWDLPYFHEYIHDSEINTMSFKDLTENVI